MDLEQLLQLFTEWDSALMLLWWEGCRAGRGGGVQSSVLWHMAHTCRYIGDAHRFFVQERQDWEGFLNECSRHERGALQELSPAWARGKPPWWLWAQRREAALYRLTRRATVHALQARAGAKTPGGGNP